MVIFGRGPGLGQQSILPQNQAIGFDLVDAFGGYPEFAVLRALNHFFLFQVPDVEIQGFRRPLHDGFQLHNAHAPIGGVAPLLCVKNGQDDAPDVLVRFITFGGVGVCDRLPLLVSGRFVSGVVGGALFRVRQGFVAVVRILNFSALPVDWLSG